MKKVLYRETRTVRERAWWAVRNNTGSLINTIAQTHIISPVDLVIKDIIHQNWDAILEQHK